MLKLNRVEQNKWGRPGRAETLDLCYDCRRTEPSWRRTRAMGAGAKALLSSCAPIVVGSLILLGALYYWRRGRELREYGVTTQATVVAKRRYRYGGVFNGSVYVMKFADLNGNPRTVEIRTRSRSAGMISEGSTFPITYIPAHPEKAEMGLKWGKYIEGWLALLVAAFGGGMVVYGLYLVFGLLTGKLKPGAA